MKKVLVTGCAGFIGSHLCEQLISRGWTVTGMDNFLDNYSGKQKERNMHHLLKQPNFEFIKQDLLEAPLQQLIEKVDYVFHLAGQPGVRGSWGGQFDSFLVNNVLATQRLLEAAKKCDIKKFVYASSSSVYGNNAILPAKETHTTRPYSPYGVTKLAAENLCALYYENYGVPTVSLRYFTVYGPRQRPDMGISGFISAMLKGLPIKVYGDGNQRRDFTYVDDITAASILAAKSATVGQVFNVSSGQPVVLIKVIRMLEKLMNKKTRIEFSLSQRGDVRDTYADIEKISRVLGFKPVFTLERGLLEQLVYMRKVIK